MLQDIWSPRQPIPELYGPSMILEYMHGLGDLLSAGKKVPTLDKWSPSLTMCRQLIACIINLLIPQLLINLQQYMHAN